jgi:hypothetical protein
MYTNVDIVDTFPIKRHYVDGVSGLDFMGNQNPKNLGKQNPIFLFILKVKYFNHHSFVIYHDIPKSLVVLESPLYQLSIWHKD